MGFKIWLKAIRMPFFTATIIPVALGSIIAWHDNSNFMWVEFLLTMLGVLLIHAGTNLANDYFDHLSGCDEVNFTPTPFSGGSRVIQEGLIAPKKILYAALVLLVLGGSVGFYLNYLSKRDVILVLGIIGILLGFFYSAKPMHIGYGGFGELAVGFCFGPLVVMGSYYVQTLTLSFRVFLISIPLGILIALVLLINEFPDYAADKAVDKKTLVVILGKGRAIILYHILLVMAYLSIIFMVILKFLPLFCLITLFSLPLALKASVVSKKNFDRVYELLPANAYTIGLHSIVGLLLCVGITLDKVLKFS